MRAHEPGLGLVSIATLREVRREHRRIERGTELLPRGPLPSQRRSVFATRCVWTYVRTGGNVTIWQYNYRENKKMMKNIRDETLSWKICNIRLSRIGKHISDSQLCELPFPAGSQIHYKTIQFACNVAIRTTEWSNVQGQKKLEVASISTESQ